MTNSLVSWQLDAANQKFGVAGWSAETVHLSVDKLSAPGYFKKNSLRNQLGTCQRHYSFMIDKDSVVMLILPDVNTGTTSTVCITIQASLGKPF